MREGKKGAINSYYKYKKKKLRRYRGVVCILGMLMMSSSIIIANIQGGNINITYLLSRFYHTPLTPGVYLTNNEIAYDLYSTPEVAKGIYIPAKKINNEETYIQLARETEVNSFVIDVKDDMGYLTFATDNPVLNEKGIVLSNPPIVDISRTMNRLCEENIYPIARIVAFKDNVIPKKEADKAVKSIDGQVYVTKGGDTWLDPYNKENWDYILEICLEAERLGFREIQFDYVRFHESMSESRVILGEEKSKTEIIVEFIQYIKEALQDTNLKISADVFGAVVLSDIDAAIVGQDFIEMSKYLDYICPMIYPSHYAEGTFGIEYPNSDPYQIILKTMNLARRKLETLEEENYAVIRPWLQDFTMSSIVPYMAYEAEQLRDQIRGANDAGVQEWIFWNAAGNYTVEGLQEEQEEE